MRKLKKSRIKEIEMKNVFLAFIFCLILFSICSSNENKQMQNTSDILVNPTLPLATDLQKETTQLSKEDIDYICDGFSNFINHCKDVIKVNYTIFLSLPPNQNMSDEELSKFLRACVYHGNMEALDELYKLVPEEDLESRYKLELAGSGIPLSDENPYQSEIFYGESYKDFPQDDTLDIVAKSLQKGKSLRALGVEEIEPNYDWERIFKIPNLHDYYKYLREDESTLGVYKLDLDKDGLMEILIFFPGGSMGNIFWEALHLDKDGHITDTNSGEGMQWMSLYRYKEDYFFTSNIIDFNDKELLGLEVYALNKKGKVFGADITMEKVGSEIIFQDKHSQTKDFYYLDLELDGFIDTYKRYEYKALGKEIDSRKMKELFNNPDELSGFYGILDINNDNVDDWTFVNKFFPSNRYPYACNYKFVEGKTNQILDFSDYFLNQNICCIIPYETNDKNYFICVLNGNKNYIIKLIEIKGSKPIELHSWLVSVKNRILIQVYENKVSHIGI